MTIMTLAHSQYPSILAEVYRSRTYQEPRRATPSRFEDGETHRSPYTSMCGSILPFEWLLVKQVYFRLAKLLCRCHDFRISLTMT